MYFTLIAYGAWIVPVQFQSWPKNISTYNPMSERDERERKIKQVKRENRITAVGDSVGWIWNLGAPRARFLYRN